MLCEGTSNLMLVLLGLSPMDGRQALPMAFHLTLTPAQTPGSCRNVPHKVADLQAKPWRVPCQGVFIGGPWLREVDPTTSILENLL